MPGLMNRASTVVKAKISKLLDRAEDPGETLDYSYEKQLELLQNVKRGVADVVTAKKRLELQTTQLEQSVVKPDGQARQANAGGRDDLARVAPQRKMLVHEHLQGIDVQLTQLEAPQPQLADHPQQLAQKLQAFCTQQDVLQAQSSAAHAPLRTG